MYTICITPTADKDLLAAIQYYNLQAEDLGYRFAEMVEDYLHRIALTPMASSVRYLSVRCKPMITFPYIICFAVDEDKATVNILRLFHSSKEPEW